MNFKYQNYTNGIVFGFKSLSLQLCDSVRNQHGSTSALKRVPHESIHDAVNNYLICNKPKTTMEPQHYKLNNMTCALSEDSGQPGRPSCSESSLST